MKVAAHAHTLSTIIFACRSVRFPFLFANFVCKMRKWRTTKFHNEIIENNGVAASRHHFIAFICSYYTLIEKCISNYYRRPVTQVFDPFITFVFCSIFWNAITKITPTLWLMRSNCSRVYRRFFRYRFVVAFVLNNQEARLIIFYLEKKQTKLYVLRPKDSRLCNKFQMKT